MGIGTISKIPSNGIIGVFYYWDGWAQDIIPLCYICFSIYLTTILSDTFWLRVIGGGTLAAVIISLVFAFASFVTHIFFQFSVFDSIQSIIKFVYIGTTSAALLVCSIAIPSFSPISSLRYYQYLFEYSTEFQATDIRAEEFINMTQTNMFAAYNFVQKRTIDIRLPLISIFSIWFTTFTLYISCIIRFGRKCEEEPKQSKKKTMSTSSHSEENASQNKYEADEHVY